MAGDLGSSATSPVPRGGGGVGTLLRAAGDVVAIKAGTAGGLLRIVFDRSWLWLFIFMLLYICELAAISSFYQTRYALRATTPLLAGAPLAYPSWHACVLLWRAAWPQGAPEKN